MDGGQPGLSGTSPGAGSEFFAPAIVRIDCADADELAEQMRDWTVELKHLRPGAFSAQAVLVSLGSVMIGRGCYSKAMVERTAAPEGCISIARPGRGSAPLSHQGHGIEDGQVFVCGPGAEHESVSHGVRHPRTVAVRLDLLEQQADWLPHAALLTASTSVHLREPGVAWTTAYLDAVEWIVDAVERYPEAISRDEVRGSLVDLLLTRINMLGAAAAPIPTDRQTRARRRAAVKRARDYIARNLTNPIRLSDLARHAHTQARSLEYGFREEMGVSPMAYVRATRLQRVRHVLRTTAVRTRSISEIALDCGFWHLSQFAVDYKTLFGESPSVTFRRTEAQLPRSGRRRNAPMSSSPMTTKAASRPGRVAAALA